MQAQADYLGVPRRELDVADYVDILRRHWMWIAGPAFAGLVIAVVTAFLWPDTYQSYAVMRITPSQVSDRIVPSNFNLHMQDRMQTMLQDVTSRSKLIDMIKKFNLYQTEQAKRPLEDIMEDMRRKIKVEPLENASQSQQSRGVGSAFRISFQYDEKHDAQKVVQEMVNSLTSENVVDRLQKSRITTEFLGEEVKTSKADLDRIESQLTQFKLRNAGRLPEELNSNLQMQNSFQQQLGAVQEVLNRDQQDKMMLETSVQNLKNQLNTIEINEVEATAPKTKVEVVKNDHLAEMEKRVTDAESQLTALREQLKPEHPDLKAAIKRVESIKQERDRVAAQVAADEEKALATQATAKPAEPAQPRKFVNPVAVKNRSELEAQLKTVQARIRGIDLDSDERIKMQKTLIDQLQQVSGRIQSNPLMQGEYADLTRDYNLAKDNYDKLSSQLSSSGVANRLEDRSAGENLEVLDPASLPLKPSDPNRWMIVGAGTTLGMILGLFLAGAQELKDSTMKGLRDVRAYSNLNILSSVPLLENALMVRRKRRLTWLAWSSAMIVGVVIMSGSVYYYLSLNP